MPDVLTDVDVWFTMNGTLMFVYVKGLAMTSSDQDIRDHVRDRYAAAALSVVVGVGGELLRAVGRPADQLLRTV